VTLVMHGPQPVGAHRRFHNCYPQFSVLHCSVGTIGLNIHNNNNNNNNNNEDDIYSAIYTAQAMQEFTLAHLDERRSAPGGRQLVGQDANLTFGSACKLL